MYSLILIENPQITVTVQPNSVAICFKVLFGKV